MKRVTGHREPWGDFVDVKINVADLLQIENVLRNLASLLAISETSEDLPEVLRTPSRLIQNES